MKKKDLKRLTKTARWRNAEFVYEDICVDNKMPFFREPLTVKEIDEYMAEILEKCPQYFPALLQRGQYNLIIGKDNRAIDFYDRGFELMIEILEGEVLFDLIERAIDGFEKHLRYDLCRRYLRRLIELYPEKAEYYDYLAGYTVQDRNGSFEQASPLQLKALELDPDNATFLSNLGWIHLMAGNLEDAEKALRKGLEIRPGDQFLKSNMEICQYLKKEKPGGTFADYLLRPVDHKELQQLEDEEEEDYEKLDSLCANYNGSRMVAFKKSLLDEGDYLPHQISSFASTIEAFFSFVDKILNRYFLFDDLVTIQNYFKPIMHKFIFKHKDIDDEIFDEIFVALIAFYDFLSQYDLVDSDQYREFAEDIESMKPELRAKMHRYNEIRKNYIMSEEEKEEIREELFEGDHSWPFL